MFSLQVLYYKNAFTLQRSLKLWWSTNFYDVLEDVLCKLKELLQVKRGSVWAKCNVTAKERRKEKEEVFEAQFLLTNEAIDTDCRRSQSASFDVSAFYTLSCYTAQRLCGIKLTMYPTPEWNVMGMDNWWGMKCIMQTNQVLRWIQRTLRVREATS